MESELSRSRSLHDRQSHDFQRQQDELLRTHGKQLAELKLATELEQAQLVEEFRAQLELHRAEKDKELSELRRTLLADAADAERRAKEQAEIDSKVDYCQLNIVYSQGYEFQQSIFHQVSLSLRFNGHLPGAPGLAGVH